jgi:cytochrome c oxidase subunit 2
MDTRARYDEVARLFLPIAVAVVVLVVLFVVVFAIRYRARPGDEDRPRGPSDAPRAELIYIALLACIAAVLVWRTFSVEAREDRNAPHAALTIDTTAGKWHWRFAYPAYGFVQQGTDRTPPTLVVPAGQVVRFLLHSPDVIHAFWIPDRRFKRDATPGRTTVFTMVFPHPGTLRHGGECSEFCGLGHTGMRFGVRVLSPADFTRWAQARARGAAA